MMENWGPLLLTVVAAIAFVVSSPVDDVKTEIYHTDGPIIFPSKKEMILQQGQNFTLTCQGKRNISFKHQELSEENIGVFNITTRYSIRENTEYKYEIALDLINVDSYAIGYYACNYSSVKGDVINSLTDEPNNTEHVSYIYIYVNGTDRLFAPTSEVVSGRSGFFVAECRPSTPDVDVKIYVGDIAENNYIRYNPKIGFVFDSESLEVLTDPGQITIFTCGFTKQHRTVGKDLFYVKQQKEQPQPVIFGGSHKFLKGETFSLNCTVNYVHNTAQTLTWKYPNDAIKGNLSENSNNERVKDGILYRSLTIVNATKDHAGTYTCFSNSNCGQKQSSFNKTYLEEAELRLRSHNGKLVENTQKLYSIDVIIDAYPPANYTFYKNDIEIKNVNETYKMTWDSRINEAGLKIKKSSVANSANYTIFATNGFKSANKTFDVRFKTAPVVTFGVEDKTCVLNTTASLRCEVTGYPLPDVTWLFSVNGTPVPYKSNRIEISSIYKESAFLDIICGVSGNITCKASNIVNDNTKRVTQDMQTRRLIVYEISGGFGIKDQTEDKTVWFSQSQNATIKCLASSYYFTNVTWFLDDDGDVDEIVEYSENEFSLVANLKINGISLNHNGTYVCRGVKADGEEREDSINVNVAPLLPPEITFISNINGEVDKYQPIEMTCIAQGVPRPTIEWYKDGTVLKGNETNIQIINTNVNRTNVHSSITLIGGMKIENSGTYECKAFSNTGNVIKSEMLVLKETAFTKYLVLIGVIIFVFIILVIYLICKIRKEKQFRKELAAAGLLNFKEGVTKSINPELGIDEQAELLPYDEKFEFSMDKLFFGKQLGAGAFGVVYKADARGIINAEETTPVAVKMVKKTADNMYIKALASELKIMVHLGKHINIVNLLGACTKNVGKRELAVIVEYCKFGNIHNYMQRHREVFIDQFSDNNKEKNYGKVNRGYDSTGSTGVQSDYGTANTQDTDHTFLTNNTNRTSRKNVPSQPTEVAKASEGYVAPEWRSNYESDYSYDGRSPRPLTSRDLIAWAFQIARGMEYLASRKVLHGDLAARNILLADDNIVKICDFGLAKSIYKNDEYQKKENCPLPVKWLAIECMTDRIFSTQSDVWSFGIVLWELFSLAKTPYPNMSPPQLLQFLSDGHRLNKPPYSDERIYNVMKQCWEQKPTARPSFTKLQETIGTFLEDNVRNHYVDLNTLYMDLNSKPEGQEDYLAMMSAPDYNNMVTPSPHHYVNDSRSFFPPTPKIDEDGYLQMSPAPNSNSDIFSPKPAGTKFDFDPRKFNGRSCEASSVGSELTPMLTLNNLPKTGSESDHEGSVSPYLNMCPRIEEETDEVFETKQNAKNVQNSAVSNPTYITFDMEVEKKPIDINNYVNIVPNGLVK